MTTDTEAAVALVNLVMRSNTLFIGDGFTELLYSKFANEWHIRIIRPGAKRSALAYRGNLSQVAAEMERRVMGVRGEER